MSQISIMSIPKMIKELSLSFSTPLPPLLPSPRPILSSLDAALMHVLHERERERERDTHTHTHTETQREIETETDREDRQIHRQTDTDTDRERDSGRTLLLPVWTGEALLHAAIRLSAQPHRPAQDACTVGQHSGRARVNQ